METRKIISKWKKGNVTTYEKDVKVEWHKEQVVYHSIVNGRTRSRTKHELVRGK